MPCYQSNLISVELKTADHDTLKAAMESLGLSFTESNGVYTIQTPNGVITLRDGKASFYNNECQKWVNKIKQAYSMKTVERVAARFKFKVTVKPGNKIVLRKY